MTGDQISIVVDPNDDCQDSPLYVLSYWGTQVGKPVTLKEAYVIKEWLLSETCNPITIFGRSS